MDAKSHRSGKAQFISMSNPNPQNGKPQFTRLTYQQIQEINRKNGITIQGFPGVFDNGVHTRFGKRICFEDLPTQKEISDQWLRETNDKFARTQRDFNLQKDTEADLIKSLKEQMANDKKRKYELLLQKREEFIRENSNQVQDRRDKSNQERKEFKEYKPTFFPFTHGEKLKET